MRPSQPSYNPIGGDVSSLFPGGGGRRKGPLPDEIQPPVAGAPGLTGFPGPPVPEGSQPPLQIPPGIDIGQIIGGPQGGSLPMGGIGMGGGMTSPQAPGLPGGGAPSARDMIMQGLQGIIGRKQGVR